MRMAEAADMGCGSGVKAANDSVACDGGGDAEKSEADVAMVPPLVGAFAEALAAKVGSGDESEREAATMALSFLEENRKEVDAALAPFGADGRLAGGAVIPASTYNDFYKFTMLPVMVATHRSKENGVRCTFSVNIRDAGYRKALVESALGQGPPQLWQTLRQELEGLARRPFDRDLFERAVADWGLQGWADGVLDEVCGSAEFVRHLADEVHVDATCSQPRDPSAADKVLVQAFVATDSKLGEQRVYVEASGPWPRVTWLETSMMQAVYEALFRDRHRSKYGTTRDELWYPKWLADAFVRCARSTIAVTQSGLRGMVMTGRRTGGMPLMFLEAMYVKKCFEGCLGTSSVTAHYWLRDAGVSPEFIPRPSGTHAHELSMVLSAVLGGVDDAAGMPLSQLVGHMAYFYKSMPQGDVREAGRKMLMPMLPDTLGSLAFMKTAGHLSVPRGPHAGEPVLSVVGAARQDSGSLADFAKLMREHSFGGALMASEIEKADDLFTAAKEGYTLFGAGGFFGDSEHAWDPSVKNISMAVKVLRVYVDGALSEYYPAKTGDDPTGSKFEADGLLSPEALEALKVRTQKIQEAEPKLEPAELQDLFVQALSQIIGPEA